MQVPGEDGYREDPLVDEEAREEIRRNLEQSLSKLNVQILRLESKYRELVSRSKEYFEQVVDAMESEDKERASIYAEEIAELRKLAKMVRGSQLMLEQVKLRLETVIEVSDLIGLVVPLLSLIAEVEDEVAGVAPEAAKNLHELACYIEDFTSSNMASAVDISSQDVSEDAKRVLEEAKKLAAERVKESFPDVPHLSEIEQMVYSYLSKAGSEINLKKCAKELGIDVKQVKEILMKLEEKGLIELVG
jgi:division protein CdvB (Snf7/Vps24/ESCRT-III family)